MSAENRMELAEYVETRLSEIIAKVYADIQQNNFFASFTSYERIHTDVRRWFYGSYTKVMTILEFLGRTGMDRKTADDILDRLYETAMENYTTVEFPKEIISQEPGQQQ